MSTHVRDALPSPPPTGPVEPPSAPSNWTEPQADDRADADAQPSDRSSGDRRQRDRSAGRGRDRSGPRTVAELTTLAFSTLIVLSLVGLTTYFHLTASTDPTIVEVEPRLGEVYQAGQRYYLPVTVRNVGGETGEEIRVRATLTDPSGRQEIAELTIAFLAGSASTNAVVSFGQDPRAGRLEIGVESYLEP